MIDVALSLIGVDKKVLMDYYNQHCVELVPSNRRYYIQPNDEWCAMFTSVCAHKAGIVDFPYEVSVYYQCQWGELTGDVGDLIVYDWGHSGGFNHVGIVWKVDDKYVHVVEGNYNDEVRIRVVKRASSVIKGYLRVNEGRINRLAERVIDGDYGNGAKRRWLLGNEFDEVQKMVNFILD